MTPQERRAKSLECACRMVAANSFVTIPSPNDMINIAETFDRYILEGKEQRQEFQQRIPI